MLSPALFPLPSIIDSCLRASRPKKSFRQTFLWCSTVTLGQPCIMQVIHICVRWISSKLLLPSKSSPCEANLNLLMRSGRPVALNLRHWMHHSMPCIHRSWRLNISTVSSWQQTWIFQALLGASVGSQIILNILWQMHGHLAIWACFSHFAWEVSIRASSGSQ